MAQDQIYKTFDLHQPFYNNIYLVAGASARKVTQASTARASTTPAGPILVKMAVYVAKSTATTTNVLVLKVRKHNPTYYLSWHTSVLELPSLMRACVCPTARRLLGSRQLGLQDRVLAYAIQMSITY